MKEYVEQLDNAVNFINSKNNFLIVSHVQPDGDTISSSLAMAHLLEYLGKSFQLVNGDSLPNKFQFLPMFNQIKSINSITDKKFSNVITIDVADKFRAGDISPLLNEDVKILNIDHHPTNDNFGDVNLILSTAAATTEVIYDLIQQMKVPLDKELATCIYTGLLTDTGGFRYSNTTAKVMKIAAQLLEYEINPGDIAQISLETISIGHVNLLKKALQRIEILENGLLSWTVITLEDLDESLSNDDTEGIVSYTRNIEGVELGILFKQNRDNEIKVSLRSNKIIDVGAIAKSFGGGGHVRAAGFTYLGTIEKVKEELLAKIKALKGWSNLEQ